MTDMPTMISGPATARPPKLTNSLVRGITMRTVAENLKLSTHYDVPESDLLHLPGLHRRKLDGPQLGLRLELDHCACGATQGKDARL